jgi:hypothetical protein
MEIDQSLSSRSFSIYSFVSATPSGETFTNLNPKKKSSQTNVPNPNATE